MRHNVATLIALVLAFVLPAGTVHSDLVFGPYLQSVAQDTMLICAYLEPGDKAAVVLLNPDQSRRPVAVDGSEPACARLTDLKPDLEYRYEMTVNDRPITPTPPPSFIASGQTDMTFVVYGDTRSGDDSFDLTHRQVVSAIRETTVPDAVLHTGDFVERGNDLSLWQNFFSLETPVLQSTPIFPSIGQSDQPADRMRTIFPILKERSWYSFDRAGCHFVVLNLWLAKDQEASEVSAFGQQARWLKEDLSRAREQGARHLFVIQHESPMDISGTINKAAREVFMPLFEAFNVTAVFSGAHYFSHSVIGEVHYLTAGGGGALLEPQEPKEGVFQFFSAIYHFLVLDVGQSGTQVRAIDAHGDEFYAVPFNDPGLGAMDSQSPTTVRSYPGRTGSVPLTVYTRLGCGDCETMKGMLPELAARTDTTLVVTFRALEDADNQASLAARTEQDGPSPITVVGDEVLVGLEEIESELESVLVSFSLRQAQNQTRPWGQWLVWIAVIVAGAILLAALVNSRSKKSTPN